MKYFPIFIDLAQRVCLLVGGDEAAARKLRLLIKAGAKVRLVAKQVTPEIADAIAGRSVAYAQRDFIPADLANVAYIVVADDTQAEAVRSASAGLGIPLNVVDRPDLSTAITPGIVDRDPVVVAIGSNGGAPVLVRRLRERIEAALPSGLGRLAAFAQRFRSAVAATRPPGDARRRFWEGFFDGPVAARVLDGREDEACDEMLQLINAAEQPAPAGSVSLVGVGPGDPDLLTLKALRAMQDADTVLYDALIGPEILDYVRRDAERICVGKRKGAHCKSQKEILELLRERAAAGRRVVRLKSGDPFLFGRGGEELVYLRQHGIAAEIVPGITAALGAAAAAEIPLTHRGLAQSCSILTGHGKDGEPNLDPALLAGQGTLAIYMGLSVAKRLAERIVAAGRPAGTPVAVVERATWKDQRTLYGTLETLGDLVRREAVAGPALLIVGDVVSLGREAAQPRPLLQAAV
ncbi:MAG: uroporphyrinogen-III C-methyltransferase [Rhodospirillales bacterium]|nr:uroporphyrinogen-III C-methyltransferase [Rhodospirillales bacterium]